MSNVNNFNQFLIPAQDANLYQLYYNKIDGGSVGCTIVVNGVTVQMGAASSIDINVNTVSGGTGCFLGGNRPYIYGDSPQYKYVPQTFVSVWDTSRTSAGSSTTTQVRLPLISTGFYNFIVEWGDGTTDRITTWNQAQTTHTYASAGVYQVTITGTIRGFRFANTGDRLKILEIFKWGTGFILGSTDSHFYGCANLSLLSVEDVLDLSQTTSMFRCFFGCTRLTHVNFMNSWDLSSITDFNQCFENATNFNTNIGNWNISNVTTLRNCFANARKFNNGGSSSINNWDTSKVTNMRFLFGADSGFHDFNQPIGNWNTSNVTTTEAMFNRNFNFNQDISTKEVTVNGVTYTAWDTLNVTNMNVMFSIGTPGIGTFNQNIGNWNTSKVTIMLGMFFNQPNFNQDISTKIVSVGGNTYTAWDTSNVTNMSQMFDVRTLGNFNQNIGNWNTSKVTLMQQMFYSQPNFNQDISTKIVTVGDNTYTAWDTLNVTNMNFMLDGRPLGNFNQNIGNWNTSKVTNMGSLLQFQPNFNQDISTKTVTVGSSTYTAWDTLNVTAMNTMLNAGTGNIGKFNQNIGNWNTSKVTNMSSMFNRQPLFNQDISTKTVTVGASTYTAWDILNATNMSSMFFIPNGSTTGSFNQNINNWNTIKVTNMTDMFSNQKEFNQLIDNWNVSLVTAFNGATAPSGFMQGKTFEDYSSANYDALLIGWSSRPVQPNLNINFGTIKRTTASDAAVAILTSAPNNWTIIDGGLI
jgi:surface protein